MDIRDANQIFHKNALIAGTNISLNGIKSTIKNAQSILFYKF